ncbi:hypothetical protein [Amycolatopsis pigmentata]|uniref:Uncharacterized protein n=1 Tax=Amycolatopsis pigmentata TaxID=450801 RepID=A0ABW5FME7_9PSEU
MAGSLMWPALLFPVVVLTGTLFMERFETALLVPKSGRAEPATVASPRGEAGKSLLWTIIVPPAGLASRRPDRAHSARDARSPADGAELEASPGAVTG